MSKTYRVIARTSTRTSTDRKSPDFDVWVNFELGSTVTTWPEHSPVAEWVASGHWQEIRKKGSDA